MRPTIGFALLLVTALGATAEPRAQDRPRLWSDVQYGRLVEGAKQPMLLSAGSEHANQPYIVLGTLSGTHPGVSVGGVHLPLNVDFYTSLTLTHPNTFLAGSFGFLDGHGQAFAELRVPPGLDAWVDGLRVHHVYVVLNRDSLVPEKSSDAVSMWLEGNGDSPFDPVAEKPGGGKGGGGRSENKVSMEFRDSPTDGVRSDQDDGEDPPDDYTANSKAKVDAFVGDFFELTLRENKRVSPQRTFTLDFGNYLDGPSTATPPGTAANVLQTQGRILTQSSYIPIDPGDLSAGWIRGGSISPLDIPMGEFRYLGLGIRIGDDETWMVHYGPRTASEGGWPINAANPVPIKVSRTGENPNQWIVETLPDADGGARAALVKKGAASVFEVEAYYNMPLRIVATGM